MRGFALVLLFCVGVLLFANRSALLHGESARTVRAAALTLHDENNDLQRQVDELERQVAGRAGTAASADTAVATVVGSAAAPSATPSAAAVAKPDHTAAAASSAPWAGGLASRCLISRWDAYWVVAGGTRFFVASPTKECRMATPVSNFAPFVKFKDGGEGYVIDAADSKIACQLRGCATPQVDGQSAPQPAAATATAATATAATAAASVAVAAAAPTELASASLSGCHATPHAGFGGHAFTWGMTFKVETAAECCAACRAHASTCGPDARGKTFMTRKFKGQATAEVCGAPINSDSAASRCNTWVFCPTPESEGGLCWSNDIHNHTFGECWLKAQPDPSRPNAGAYQEYPAAYREKHHTAPERVQWMSGVLTDAEVVVDGPHWHWR